MCERFGKDNLLEVTNARVRKRVLLVCYEEENPSFDRRSSVNLIGRLIQKL